MDRIFRCFCIWNCWNIRLLYKYRRFSSDWIKQLFRWWRWIDWKFTKDERNSRENFCFWLLHYSRLYFVYIIIMPHRDFYMIFTKILCYMFFEWFFPFSKVRISCTIFLWRNFIFYVVFFLLLSLLDVNFMVVEVRFRLGILF